MFKVKIYGAGSIGNHLAFACRNKGWEVLICDVDPKALERTRTEIYPSRYGKWDEKIRLATVNDLPNETYDLVILGTPPDTHQKLALDLLRKNPPKVLLVEKPLCTPALEHCDELVKLAKETGTFIGVAYNHTLTTNTNMVDGFIKQKLIGEPQTLVANFREYWGGIFAAHPWLQGPWDTYLGFSDRGGGASGEHSHAINIWQHFSHSLGMGRVKEVSAMLDFVDTGKAKYDRLCQLSVRTERGLVGTIVQDVVTEPAEKKVRIQGSNGAIEWQVNFDKSHDAVRLWEGKNPMRETLINKTRPDDFKGEIDHVEALLKNPSIASPISLERGLDTMMVVTAAHISNKLGRTVKINYETGFRPESIVVN